MGARARLESIFRAALAAVEPAAAVRQVVRGPANQLEFAGRPVAAGARIFALAVGKAAAPMAQALEQIAAKKLAMY